MRWSIKIARIAGIEVRIHFTFLIFLGWIGFEHYKQGGGPAALEGVVFILALFGCVLLHEFGHALAAARFGIKTPDITLLPIGGVARMQRMPDKPWQELIVALAGPAVNVLIASLLILFLGWQANMGGVESLQDPSKAMLPKLVGVNIWLVLFNMIPAFPMDGGRVLRSLLAMRLNYARATQIAASIGQGLAFVFGFVGLAFGQPMLIFIALFVYLGAQQEAAMAQLREVSTGLRVAEAMVTELVTLKADATLDAAVEALLRTSQHEFPVLDAEGRVLGVLMQSDLIAALKQHGPAARVGDFMRRDLPSVHPQDRFDDAFRVMNECGCPALPVVDSAGRLAGLITPENIGEMMLVQSVLPRRAAPPWRPSQTG